MATRFAADVVTCPACGARNRLPAMASGRPRCGRCHRPLAWIAEADDTTFSEVVESALLPVVTDFWAPWCAPCLRISPALERIAADLAGRMKLVKINVDDTPGLSKKFDIRHVPTLMVFHRGELVSRLPAGAPADQIRAWVTEKVTDSEQRDGPRS
ncbi:thioredoxin [Actinomadura nitritigenes]|uniref:Thiol reductase thioredoxin n=1 Tax=Actinomadura nitritigenes TaxID=134602 RepID=A0ABS3RDA9_9ACTN|nr:thioredoxin domain-containing protein [Actinomadura nitritigenes]MBO2443857.1 thiol reductase thioredoxin [Actinomadura nitritigenes]